MHGDLERTRRFIKHDMHMLREPVLDFELETLAALSYQYRAEVNLILHVFP